MNCCSDVWAATPAEGGLWLRAWQAMEAGKSDVFFVKAPSLGELYKVKVSHDGSGLGADWRPAMFEVRCLLRASTYLKGRALCVCMCIG